MEEENKENALPMVDDEPEQEIMDIYEDSNRRIELIKEEPKIEAPIEVKKKEEPEPIAIVQLPKPSVAPISFFDNKPLPPEEDEYPKVSVKNLVNTFEGFQAKEKVHVNKSHIIKSSDSYKESSSESDVSKGKTIYACVNPAFPSFDYMWLGQLCFQNFHYFLHALHIAYVIVK